MFNHLRRITPHNVTGTLFARSTHSHQYDAFKLTSNSSDLIKFSKKIVATIDRAPNAFTINNSDIAFALITYSPPPGRNYVGQISIHPFRRTDDVPCTESVMGNTPFKMLTRLATLDEINWIEGRIDCMIGHSGEFSHVGPGFTKRAIKNTCEDIHSQENSFQLK